MSLPRLGKVRLLRCDACHEVPSPAFAFAGDLRDGLCRDCRAAGIERCEWCREPAPGPRRGYARDGGDPRPKCAAGHPHTQCPDCVSPLCPDSDEAQVVRAVMA